MAERTISEAYEIILEHLRKRGFGWVVEQIQEQVRSGKPLIKDVSLQPGIRTGLFADEKFEIKTTAKGRRQRLAATENYTDKERLEIAVTAIESVAIQTTVMQEELAAFFASSMDEPQKILFEPDEFDETDSLVLERPSKERRESVDGLKELLEILREEAGIGNKR